MDIQKAIGKDGTYPPAPSVEDGASPVSSTHDFYDDCHEFDEAYLQAYTEYKYFGKELGQEEDAEAENEEVEAEAEQEQEEGSSQILIEYISNVDSPTVSSNFPPPEAQDALHTHTAVYCEHVALPFHQHHSAQPRYHYGVHSALAQTRPVQETPHRHHVAAPPLHAASATHRLQQRRQDRYTDRLQYPVARCICGVDDSAVRPKQYEDAHVLQNFSRERCSVARQSDVLSHRGGVPDEYFRRRYDGGAERRDSRDGRGAEEVELFEKFAEVFNAMRRVDAHTLALRKTLQGLLLERFGGRAGS